MRISKKVLATLLTASMVASTAVCGASADDAVNLTLWGAEEDQTLLSELAEEFKAAYPDTTFNIQIGVESESTAKDTILTDVEAAADVFAFASDQLYDLVNAGALLNLSDENYEGVYAMAGKTLDDIKNANTAGSVEAASKDGNLYAFPRSGDNGYFLFYDSSVLSEEDVASWDSLLDAAEAAGKKVGMTYASGWYNASFFYGAGFTTGRNDDNTTSIDWNGTSADGYTGVDVVKSMLTIAAHPAFMAASDISNQLASGALVACVSGTWDSITAQDVYGDGYAATKLPTFTVAGDQVQQGSVAGFKFVGVNGYSENAGWAILLADFITSEEAQQKFFDQRESGPTNVNIIESDAVKENVAIAALAEQSEFSTSQIVGDKFWDPSETFGELIAQGTISVDDDAAIQEALDTLVEGVTAPIE